LAFVATTLTARLQIEALKTRFHEQLAGAASQAATALSAQGLAALNDMITGQAAIVAVIASSRS
jgi:hypothetical protein